LVGKPKFPYLLDRQRDSAVRKHQNAVDLVELTCGDAGVGSALVDRCATVGIVGGAVHDALVAEAARVHDLMLISCDRRAASSYQVMGTRYELVG
jgi:predicted nucleic acid-binding protein